MKIRYGKIKDKGIVWIARQEVTFREECRKIKGYGSLKEDFYTKFKPIFESLGCDVANVM